MSNFSVNEVRIIGNLTKTPELHKTTSGKSVTNIGVATNRGIRREDGWHDIATYHRVVAWEKIAEFSAESLKKGDRVYIAGHLESRQHIEKDTNEKRTIIEIIADNIIPMMKTNENFDVSSLPGESGI